MNLSYGLGRKIASAVASTVLLVHAVIFILCYAIYYLAGKYWPTLFDCESDLPTLPDFLLFLVLGLVAVLVSLYFSTRIARRLVEPLNSVATGIRCVAAGDLGARAQATEAPLGEASALVQDFNQMAEKLQRAVNERAQWNAAIAHELRTPVTILRGRLLGFADGVFPPTEEALRKLLTQVDGLSRLIEDLRLLSLFESHQLRLDLRSVNLEQEIRTVGDIYEPMLQKAGLRLRILVEAMPVRCDPLRIRQALVALLDNALKYATAGELWVRFAREGEDNVLRVNDAGPGLPDAAMQQVFQAFWQADSVSAKIAGGNGLGLSVVKAIAMAHGGDARCTANEAGGTSFSIRWPIASPDAVRSTD